MRTALVGVKKEVVFENYCQQLGVIADQLEELARFAAKGKGRNRSIMPPSYSVANKNSFIPQLQANTRTYRASPAPTTVNSDNMDWQPTAASATSPRRAKLVSKQEMEKRKQQNRCFRCGGSGHRINQCPYLPPKSPAQSPAHVATTHSYEPELEDEESLAEDTRMEGKE
jgi:hypothetical protein